MRGAICRGRHLMRASPSIVLSWVNQMNLRMLPRAESTLKRIEKMDVPDNMPVLEEIGRKAAGKLIDASHFPAGFDLS